VLSIAISFVSRTLKKLKERKLPNAVMEHTGGGSLRIYSFRLLPHLCSITHIVEEAVASQEIS
jgi:hypothetical protein